MEKKELLNLIQKGEGNRVDFKETITHKQKIAKTIVSFANSQGGILLIGVKDNKIIIGIDPESEKFMLETAVKEYCKPEIILEFDEAETEGKTVLIVHIKKTNNNINYALDESGKWIAYVRVRDKSIKASIIWLNAMKLKYSNEELMTDFNKTDKLILETIGENAFDWEEICTLTKLNKWKVAQSISKLLALDCLQILFDTSVEKFRQNMLVNQ